MDTDAVIEPPELGVTINLDVSGIVKDLAGMPVEGATIQLGNALAISDRHGYFGFKNQRISIEGELIRIDKEGFFSSYRIVLGTDGATSFAEVLLLEKKISDQLNTSQGGEVSIIGGGSVSIPANSVVQSNGEAYQGDIKVYTHWFDPRSTATISGMPGDLRAITADDRIAQLTSYGMLLVELESDQGKPLNLKDGSRATLRFPLSGALLDQAPQQIPLWYFDELSGYWREEGVAELNGTHYVGEVTHFSFWNCDEFEDPLELEGRLTDHDGNALGDFKLSLHALSEGLTAVGRTDENGRFKTYIPKDRTLVLKAYNSCDEEIYWEEMGPFSENTDLGDLSISLSDQMAFISGHLLDCEMNAMENAYVVVLLDGLFHRIIVPDDSGIFHCSLGICQSTELTIYGFDQESTSYSEQEHHILIPGENYDLGDLLTCESNMDEYVRYYLHDGPMNLLTEVYGAIAETNSYLVYGHTPGTLNFELIVPGLTEGKYTPTNLNGKGYTDATTIGAFECVDTECTSFEVTITQAALLGEFLEGHFENTTNQGEDIWLEGMFRVKIREEIRFGSVSGMVWEDENTNGIRESSETPIPNTLILLEGPDAFTVRTVTDADGLYHFDHIKPGNYNLIISTTGSLTDQDQGSDDTIDSDFDPLEKRIELSFTSAGESYTSLDAGMPYSFFCEVVKDGCAFYDNCSLTAHVYGATPPLEYLWSNGEITESVSCQTWSPVQTHYVTVTDAVGRLCAIPVQLDLPSSSLQLTIWEDQDNGTAGVYDPDLNEPLIQGVEVHWYIDDVLKKISWTDESGVVRLLAADPGIYHAEVKTPAGYSFVAPNAGTAGEIDSSIDPDTGLSDGLNFESCHDIRMLYCGLTQQ